MGARKSGIDGYCRAPLIWWKEKTGSGWEKGRAPAVRSDFQWTGCGAGAAMAASWLCWVPLHQETSTGGLWSRQPPEQDRWATLWLWLLLLEAQARAMSPALPRILQLNTGQFQLKSVWLQNPCSVSTPTWWLRRLNCQDLKWTASGQGHVVGGSWRRKCGQLGE